MQEAIKIDSPNGCLGQPGSLALDSQGNLFVLSVGTGFIHVFG
jgi:hypothetical protein